MNERLSPFRSVALGRLITVEGYEPLCKGETYLVFLAYMENTQMYSVISGGLSVVPLEDLQEADNLDIAYKAVLDFGESDIKEADKEEILAQKESETKKTKKGKNTVITLQDYEYQCNYMESEDGYSLYVE